MFERPRQTLWQWIGQGYERFRLKRKIQQLLHPYLKDANAFVPQPPTPHRSRRCAAAMSGLGRPVTLVRLVGNTDAYPAPRYRTVGSALAYAFRDDAGLGRTREWIRPLIREILNRRFGYHGLPSTLYGRDNAHDLLYFAVVSALTGNHRPELWQLVELAASGNEPTYLIEDDSILVVRCDLNSTVPVPVTEHPVRLPQPWPVPI
jgi:hypothetical protein